MIASLPVAVMESLHLMAKNCFEMYQSRNYPIYALTCHENKGMYEWGASICMCRPTGCDRKHGALHVTHLPCSKGPLLQHFVIVQLVQLLCRTIKLGWMENDAHRAVVDECKALMGRGSAPHYLLALRVLNSLVQVSVQVQ